MRAAIFNPYLDTLGGGERYAMSVALSLHKAGYEVDIEWKEQNIIQKLEGRFGMDLSFVNLVSSIKKGNGYDVCFWVSDGSIPLLYARKNFLHFQVPFMNVSGNTLINRMKLFRIKKVICNSNFTKHFIDREFGVKSEVLYPPVDVARIKTMKKEDVILFVGRFSSLLQSKGQGTLIESFKKLVASGFGKWKLVLAGGTEIGSEKLLRKLKKEAKNYPIKIIEKPSFRELKELYGRAKIFWSASGWGVDEQKEPQKMEHFGITVVESMAAGCVPVIYEGGGHKEIVIEGESGFLWKEKVEFLRKTIELINSPKELLKVAKRAKEESKNFSYERFEEKFISLL